MVAKGFSCPSCCGANLPLDRIEDCDRLNKMRQLLLYLVGLALVVPFGALEAAEDTTAKKGVQELVQSSPDEVTATSEGEAEDPEVDFHCVPFFERSAQLDGRLPLFQVCSFTSSVVDPQDCRPPPQA